MAGADHSASDHPAGGLLGKLARLIMPRLAAVADQLPEGFFSRGNQLGLDAAACAVALYFAFQLRFDGAVPLPQRVVMWSWLLLLPALRPGVTLALGGYDRIWRFFNLRDAVGLGLISLPPTLFLLVLRYAVPRESWESAIPAGVVLVELLLFLALAAGIRALRRMTFEYSRRTASAGTRALVVGTADTLDAALRHVSSFPDVTVVGLLAPEGKLQGLRIAGFSVMDEPSALPRLLASRAADLVLIADASLDSIAETVATATEFGVDVRLLPSAANIIRGEVRVSAQPRVELAFEDRPTTLSPPHPEVMESFRDRTILVTGAGGSIGAELCRQIAGLAPAALLLFDRDENAIFEIYEQLSGMAEGTRIVPLVGDIRDHARMQAVFGEYLPQVVLHAAAYKHVPIMESNPCEAVLNNVVGTREVADLALHFGAERFLMVSTDKAVRPSSVMGATKRVAELVVQSRAASARGIEDHNPSCACVRFGNVVGSRGSVVPTFLRQIAEGGPLTVTDEDMTRYFMTIPEAVQLVLQAATLGQNGNVYMLDMGDPVKITDLARKLIEMSGLRPDKDIEIRIVGARPGEKLYEELWTEGARVRPTRLQRIFAVEAEPVSPDFESALCQLERAALMHDKSRVIDLLRAMPIGFHTPTHAAVTPS
ncbi:MAG TPA: nucleoside-diphosphate sugar epimerase/dehydratase [Terriglobales bacterium]|nr:nucleoside-diphosphate sugar epimerase/dehydratase [Terriglobales bacterium]